MNKFVHLLTGIIFFKQLFVTIPKKQFINLLKPSSVCALWNAKYKVLKCERDFIGVSELTQALPVLENRRFRDFIQVKVMYWHTDLWLQW